MKRRDWELKNTQDGIWAVFQKFACPKCGRERVAKFGTAQWCRCNPAKAHMTRMKGKIEE